MKKADVKKSKGGILLGSIIKLAFFAFVLYALISIITVQVDISDKKEHLASLQNDAAELKEKNAEYERLLDVNDEKEYMKRIAMDKLGYAYPNEIRYYDISRD